VNCLLLTSPKYKGVVARFLFGGFCADERQRGNPKSQAPSTRQIPNPNLTMFETEQITIFSEQICEPHPDLG
jgi:hypothetical protein